MNAEGTRTVCDTMLRAGARRLVLAGSQGYGAAEIIERIDPAHRARVGICLDSCHVYAAGYDLVTDLEPVVLLPSNPMIIVSKTAVPAKSLAELLAWLKARPSPATTSTSA